MSWLMAALYDRMMREVERACLHEWRGELLRDLDDEVLEVGAGTGANLPHYPPRVSRLVLAEPDPHMRRRLGRGSPIARTEISDASLPHLPMPDAVFDAVVGTLVLCSVPDLDSALSEIFRVLKPGGRFLFLEHVAADQNPKRLRWQRRLEPVWKRIAGNCHLTRRTEQAIVQAGFVIERSEHASIRKAIPLARPSVRGIARKPASS